jgi:hypothetical protein
VQATHHDSAVVGGRAGWPAVAAARISRHALGGEGGWPASLSDHHPFVASSAAVQADGEKQRHFHYTTRQPVQYDAKLTGLPPPRPPAAPERRLACSVGEALARLARDDGPAADRRSAAGAGARLDPKHSHLILVDDGTKGNFGREIELRGLFEAHVRQPRGAGDEAFIIRTMRDLKLGWEGSAEAHAPPPPAHISTRLGCMRPAGANPAPPAPSAPRPAPAVVRPLVTIAGWQSPPRARTPMREVV